MYAAFELEKDQRPQNWGTLISNSYNFYQISSDVFRSEQPSIDLIPSLEAHQINTIINLRARNEDAIVLKDQPFNLVHIPINTWAINRKDLLEAMRVIQTAKQQNQKILVHCYHAQIELVPQLRCIELFLSIGQLKMRLKK